MSSVIIVSTCQLGTIKSEGGHYKQLRGSVWPLTGAWPSEAWAGGGEGSQDPLREVGGWASVPKMGWGGSSRGAGMTRRLPEL